MYICLPSVLVKLTSGVKLCVLVIIIIIIIIPVMGAAGILKL